MPSATAGRGRALSALVPLALVGLVLAGCATGEAEETGRPVAQVSVHDEDGLNGVVLPEPYDVPHTALRDTAGRPFDLATDATAPLTLVFFGYTHCPDICQVVMADIAAALVRLDRAHRDDVAMLFVTTDPARDTPRVLRAYLDRFNPAFEGLTGDLARIVRTGAAFDVEIKKGERLASGGYDVAHGTQVVGVRRDGTAPYVWTEGTAAGALAEDLVKILDGKVRIR